MAATKKADLLMILGPKVGSKKGPGMGGMSASADNEGAEGSKDTADEESSEYGGEFDAAASEAFPDMSPEQKDAFWRAVAACVDRLKGEAE